MSALDLRLYAVADPQQTLGRDLVELVLAAVAGGAGLVQLRDKQGTSRAQLQQAQALRAALPKHVPLIINDRIDIAHAAGADGVHLGRTDLPPSAARAILGERAIVGITIHHPHEAAADARVDYAGLGPVFSTTSKDPGDPPMGTDGLHRLAIQTRERLGPLPLCAIAGIDAARAGAVIAAGVDGVAVIGALFRRPDVRAAAAELRGTVDQALVSRTCR